MCVAGGRFKKEIVVDGQSYLLLIRDEGGPPEAQVSINRRQPTTSLTRMRSHSVLQRTWGRSPPKPFSVLEGFLSSKILVLQLLQIRSQGELWSAWLVFAGLERDEK